MISILLAGLAVTLEAVAVAQPVNNLAPEVVGNASVGERIVCAAGSWYGSVSEFRYTWLRDGIPFSTGVAYQVSSADRGHRLWCAVTASGFEGSAEAESSNSLAIPGGVAESPPVSTSPPEVSGTPTLGSPLSCSTGGWTGTPAPTYTYRWLRDGISVEGASASVYTVTAADQGHALSCLVTATNGAGHASAISKNSLRVPGIRPVNTVPPRVLGVDPSAVGETVSCATGTWTASPAPAFAYRWVHDRGLLSEEPVAGAAGASYTIAASDRLRTLACVVTATNSEGKGEAVSANSIAVQGSAPHNVVPPAITGTPAFGQTLRCSAGTWTGAPAPTVSFLWVRDHGTASEEAVGSSSNYVVQAGDIGHSLLCEATARNGEGEAAAASELIVIPQGGGLAPHNVEPPHVTGSPAVGQLLACSPGTWSGNPGPELFYGWSRDGAPIVGASGSSYAVNAADQGHQLACVVTAVNTEGVASATSTNAVSVPGVVPLNVVTPHISGTPAVSQPLTCAPGVWEAAPAATFAYQWLRDGSVIPGGANTQVYTVGEDDRGTSLACRVTAHNSLGSGEAVSSGLAIPGSPPLSMAAPSISGVAKPGQLLTCAHGGWSGAPAPTYSYQWQVNGIDIPSATGPTYEVADINRGFILSCVVTATNRWGSESATSEGVRVPGARPEASVQPLVLGTPGVGQQLTCQRGTWNGAPPPEFRYEWLRDGAAIAGATGSVYTVELSDQGHTLACRVTASNSEGSASAPSANELSIPLLASHALGTVLSASPLTGTRSTPSAAQLRAMLRQQLTHIGNTARLASLRKSGNFRFRLAMPAAGAIQIFWYRGTAPGREQPSAARQLLLGQTMNAYFDRPRTRTLTLRLTSFGRSEIVLNRSVAVNVRAVVRPKGHPLSVLMTLYLNR